MVEMDCGHFYDFYEYGVFIICTCWCLDGIYVFAFHFLFLFPFPISPSIPTYYITLFLFGFFLVLFSGYIFRLPGFFWWAAGLVYSAFLFVKRFRASDWISDRSIKTICFSFSSPLLFFFSLLFLPFYISTSLSQPSVPFPFVVLHCNIGGVQVYVINPERFYGGFFSCSCLLDSMYQVS